MTKDTKIHTRNYYVPPKVKGSADAALHVDKRTIHLGDRVQVVDHSGEPATKNSYEVSRIFKVGTRGQWRLGFEGDIQIDDQLWGVTDGALAADFRKVQS